MRRSFDLTPGETAWLAERALLIGTESPAASRQLARALKSVLPEEIEIVPALCSVLIESTTPLEAEVEDRVESAWSLSESDEEITPTHHRLEVVLDGEDLPEACDQLGCTPGDVAQLLSAVDLEVGVVGFSPGFGYLLGELGALAELPRRATPRSRVPAGSLAAAAGQLAIYPQQSPGGWWLLGRSPARLFDPWRAAPSLLAAGDRVEFRVLKDAPHAQEVSTPEPARSGGVLAVRTTVPGTLVVDDGRRGYAAIGVGPSGPADPESAGALRALLGGAPGVIECPAPGLELDVVARCTVASVGAALELDGRILPEGRPIHLSSGRLRVVRLRGARGYVGLAGGPVLPRVLGSMATSMLSRLGPGFLVAGQVLCADEAGALQTQTSVREGPQELRLVPGPHHRVLLQGMHVLDGLRVTVGAPSNRVGLRLHLEQGPLERGEGEVTSVPVITGAIQLPPDGQPVILGPDRATLGGYPLIACVIGADLGRLGRLAEGDAVTLRMVDLDEARRVRP